MLVGTKLEHVVSKLALEVKEQQTGTSNGAQVKPRDGLFWFGKPEILLRLIQFIIFQNAFEMATFIWFLVRPPYKMHQYLNQLCKVFQFLRRSSISCISGESRKDLAS
jgi:hypothetical protein